MTPRITPRLRSAALFLSFIACGALLRPLAEAETSAGTLTLSGSNTVTGGTLIGGTYLPPSDVLSYGPVSMVAPKATAKTVQLGAPHDFDRFRGPGLTIITYPFPITTFTPRVAIPAPNPLTEFSHAPSSLTASAALDSSALFIATTEGDGQILRVDFSGGTANRSTVATFDAAATGSRPGRVLMSDGTGHLLGITRSGGAHGKGTIYRFDPSNSSLTSIFDFPADLPGVANGLLLNEDGSLYGISSVLADTGSLELSSTDRSATTLAALGATIPAHGSIFSLSAAGDFTYVKRFTADEAQAYGALPPAPNVIFNLTTIIGTPPQLPPIYSTHTFFPLSLGRNGDQIYTWVSGGLYEFPRGSTDGTWVKPTAEVEILNVNATNSPYSLVLFSRSRFFGRAFDDPAPATGGLSRSITLLTDEAPTFIPGQGNVFTSREIESFTLDYPSAFTSSISRLAGTVSGTTPATSFNPLSRTRAIFPTDASSDFYRLDTFIPGGASISTVSDGRLRPLADFAQILTATPLPGPAPQSLAVIAIPTGGAAAQLFTLSPATNTPPIAYDLDLRGTLPLDDRSGYKLEIPNLFDPNSDPSTLTGTSAGAYGRGEIAPPANGFPATLYYYRTPSSAPGQPVTYPAVIEHDTITYTMTDDHGGSVTANIRVGNEIPVATTDFAEFIGTDTNGDALWRATPMANDRDANSDPLAALVVLQGDSPMSLTKSDDGLSVIIHVPSTTTLPEVIPYALGDGPSMTLGFIRIGNTPPTAHPLTVLTNGRDPITIPLASLFTDDDGDSVTVSVVENPVGTASIGTDSITLTPKAKYNSADVTVTLRGQDAPDQTGPNHATTVAIRVVNPFLLSRGSISGLLSYGAGLSGALRVTLTPGGSASVQLALSGATYRGTITIPLTGASRLTFTARDGAPISVDLSVDATGDISITGLVTIGGESYPVALVSGSDAPAGGAGQYNVVLERDSDAPMHYGYAVVRLNGNGVAQITGRMPDNTAWSASAPLDTDGNFTVFARLGNLVRMVSGVWSLNGVAGIDAISGSLTWTRSATVKEDLTCGGSRYLAPRRGLNAFGEARSTITSYFSAPGLKPADTARFIVSPTSSVTQISRSTPLVRCSLNPATGTFSGYAMLRNKFVAVPFSGVLRGTEGFGVIASSSGPGSVVILSRARPTLNLQTGGSVITGGVIITTNPFPRP